ncbi:MAG: YitT family protein, partial [Prevotella sp.]|nr:YitT family protein [Prevotella sp.]
IDGTIILIGGLVFGNINAVLYGIVMTILSSLVIDKIMYGSGMFEKKLY